MYDGTVMCTRKKKQKKEKKKKTSIEDADAMTEQLCIQEKKKKEKKKTSIENADAATQTEANDSFENVERALHVHLFWVWRLANSISSTTSSSNNR